MRPALRRAVQVVQVVQHDTHSIQTSVPTFLCPLLLRTPIALHPPITPSNTSQLLKRFSTFTCRKQETSAIVGGQYNHHNHATVPRAISSDATSARPTLPRSCPGCGAPTQVIDREEAGYYNIDRRHVKSFLRYEPATHETEIQQNDIYAKALKDVDSKILEEMGVSKEILDASPQSEEFPAPATPVCDRCHNLVHHHVGTPIYHPSVESIQETIAESPHRRNHIYHVVDAADFPLSLIPSLQSSLRLPKLRTQNRRAKHKGWVANNRTAEISFVVTRADLLAPLKEQVDKLMPYIRDVLRTSLGRVNRNARLGNVYLVSAKRGWWTKQVKEDIWDRGGAGWMVGKVNVGKSNLFEVVFPKGRGSDYQDVRKIRSAAEKESMLQNARSLEELSQLQLQFEEEDAVAAEQEQNLQKGVEVDPEEVPSEQEAEEDYDPDSLLPPAQPYTPYPVLPLASSLPGTTASPIRIPFGRNRGELIDLPGLARTTPELTTFVKPEHHDDLVMEHRVTAQRYVLKPGQSLLLGGGLVRITPVTEDLVFLVHPFVPVHPHVTATEKAIGFQTQTRDTTGLDTILAEGVGDQIKSAGRFKLQWDATKKLAGPLTSSTAGRMKPENLPFRILSTDILVEGVGWVEVSAQVRKPRGWKAVGMQKKDPNHARHAKLRAQEEERLKKEDKFMVKQQDAKIEGDAFDRAGLGDGDGGRSATSSSSSSSSRRRDAAKEAFLREELEREEDEEQEQYPEIEVFTPLGKYIGARQPMCGSILGGPKPVSSRERHGRPRRSMVSVKKQRKPMAKTGGGG